jgi:hypothetical protein
MLDAIRKATRDLKSGVWDSFKFADVQFTNVVVHPRSREVYFRNPDITGVLHRRFTRTELERIRERCIASLIAKDSPIAFAEGMPRRPFAEYLLEQVNLVLAGRPREV